MNFLLPKFCNRFKGKGEPLLHVTSYLLVVSAIRDKPVALIAMFVHSLTEDSITWYNEFVRDYHEASCQEMFKRFFAPFRTKKPRRIFVGEVVALTQGPNEPFTKVVERFNAMASDILQPQRGPSDIQHYVRKDHLYERNKSPK
ncbi:hypothetical protein AMTR_s00093p00166840 [Amborella trichopoda]|uniref:Retrotransposon gag domain-containing protein n=1 Tax=Amborella trichopoda TaxID=13333 RepID=W1NSW7_AMBTC|nr:hypothetical protein AMTR_s00093p00166840 [Amborella trichopoda]